MKRLILITLLAALPFSNGMAQEAGKSLASTLEVYVFPAAGQPADQQSKDEAECYSWAVSNTGLTSGLLIEAGDPGHIVLQP